MDRLFLDANVLFSAAYQPDAGLLALWKVKGATLVSSRYAIEEARVNLEEEFQHAALETLSRNLVLADGPGIALPRGVLLPEKDVPIMKAAIAASATHSLTGDVRHFGPYFGKTIGGLLILRPGVYLAARASKRN
jgi:hypothetical protein